MANQESDYSAQFNVWTRNHDDQCSLEIQRQMSEKPMKYVTYTAPYKEDECDINVAGSLCGGVSHVGHISIEGDNQLRPELTNKNDIHQLNNPLFLTQPYMGNGEFIGDKFNVSINSKLRSDPTKEDASCFRPQVSYHTPHILTHNPQEGAVIPDGWVQGGRSSRMDMRELHNQVCKSQF